MALFNPFRETAPSPQKPAPPIQSNETLKCTSPINRTNGFRDKNAGRFQRGRLRGGSGFRGRGGRGRGGRPSGDWRGHSGPFSPFAPEEDSAEILCDACERVFFSEEDLKEHVSMHVNCPHCRYGALQQLVDLHVKLVHDKHLASKVMEQSPEEIAEYLAERRRRFPRKIAGSDEANKAERTVFSQDSSTPNPADETKGVIHEDNVRGNKRGKFGHSIVKDRAQGQGDAQAEQRPQRSRNRKRKRGKQSHGPKQAQMVTPAEDDSPQTLEGVPRFRGLPRANKPPPKPAREETRDEAEVVVQDNISDVDDYTPAPPSQLPLVAASVLASLMACYSDSEDEEVSKPSTAKVARANEQDKEDLDRIPEQSKVRSSDNNTSSCSSQPTQEMIVVGKPTTTTSLLAEVDLESAVAAENVSLELSTKPSRSDGTVFAEVNMMTGPLVDQVALKGSCPSNRASREAPPRPGQMSQRKLSLLEKLLAKDIRHERNILLQCVDFVVQNKFFDNMGFDV